MRIRGSRSDGSSAERKSTTCELTRRAQARYGNVVLICPPRIWRAQRSGKRVQIGAPRQGRTDKEKMETETGNGTESKFNCSYSSFASSKTRSQRDKQRDKQTRSAPDLSYIPYPNQVIDDSPVKLSSVTSNVSPNKGLIVCLRQPRPADADHWRRAPIFSPSIGTQWTHQYRTWRKS